MKALVSGLGALVLALGLGACGGDDDENAGGATTCGTFLDLTGDEQKDVIKKFLDDKGGSTSNGNITLNKMSAIAFCKTAGSDSSTISEIDG